MHDSCSSKTNIVFSALFTNFEIMASSSKSTVYFFYEIAVPLRERTALKKFIASIFKTEKKRLSGLNYIFCTDKRLLEINRQFLKHDYYTDIITFPLNSPGEPVEAEIYISIDRVRDNASTLGESFSREIHRVIFHGALHLCGYGDKTGKEREIMRGKEDGYLRKYFKS
jgi:probable rRNA maturation factor